MQPKKQKSRFRNNETSMKRKGEESVYVTIRNQDTEVSQAMFRHVIFPDNKWIKRWDVLVLVALFILCFLLPYQIGVSGGHEIVMSIPWLVFNMFLNSIFFVDTFLYFFRAYFDPNTGVLIWHPQNIRRRYLRTYFIPNALSVLPFTLTFYILSKRLEEERTATATIVIIKLCDMMKLFRLVRVRSIMASSNVVRDFRQRSNSQVLELYTYVAMIVMVSHWFACIWCFVALTQAQGFNKLTERPNWIGNWVADNSVDGGLNPLGRANHVDRYFLSLFWSIQTLTSIGYGNIAPVTRTEWIIACLLQLMAGVMWAYVIGGLVGVAAGIQVRAAEYRIQADDANALIRQFESADDSEECRYSGDDMKQRKHLAAHQIRRYVYKQYTSAKTHASSTTLTETFPVYGALSPQLQQDSSWLIFHPYINSVPYLSDKYLSDKEQARVAMKCRVMYYGAGETADFGGGGYNPIGIGIPVLASGCVFTMHSGREDLPFMKRFGVWSSARTPYGVGRALLDESHPLVESLKIRMHFASFTKIIFIPQEAVLEALERNKEAWRRCARWWYVRFILVTHQDNLRRESKGPAHMLGKVQES